MREDLVTTAVNFLQNQKIQSSPLQQRIIFLEKKGLDQGEITEALKRSGIKEKNDVVLTNQNQYPTESRWEKASQVVSTIVLVGGAIYFANYIFKKYIAPWLGWAKKGPSLKDALISVTVSNERMVGEAHRVSARITEMQRQIYDMQVALMSNISKPEKDDGNIIELKNELKSVKALLLRRDQFPPPPVANPVIPAWQLERKPIGSDINENNGLRNVDLIQNQQSLERKLNIEPNKNNMSVDNQSTTNSIEKSKGTKLMISDVDLVRNGVTMEAFTDNVIFTRSKNDVNNGLPNDKDIFVENGDEQLFASGKADVSCSNS